MDLYEIARKELGLSPEEDLPAGLFTLLNEADGLCMGAGGEIRSRQVVALIILLWRTR